MQIEARFSKSRLVFEKVGSVSGLKEISGVILIIFLHFNTTFLLLLLHYCDTLFNHEGMMTDEYL